MPAASGPGAGSSTSEQFLTPAQLAAASAQQGNRRRWLDTDSNRDDPTAQLRKRMSLVLRATAANAQGIRFLALAVFISLAMPVTAPIMAAILAAGKAYADLVQGAPGRHGSPHRQVWRTAVDAAVTVATEKGRAALPTLVAHRDVLTSPDRVSHFVPQFYKKAWGSNANLKKQNPGHVDMFNVHVAATPAGREAVEAWRLLCRDTQGATMHEGAAPPSNLEHRLQEAIQTYGTAKEQSS